MEDEIFKVFQKKILIPFLTFKKGFYYNIGKKQGVFNTSIFVHIYHMIVI